MKRLNISWETREGAGCLILYGVTILKLFSRRQDCLESRDESLIWLEKKEQPIIFAQNWEQYEDSSIDYKFEPPERKSNQKGSFTKLNAALELTIGRIVARGNRILLIGGQVDPGCRINLPRIEQGPLPRFPTSCPPVARQVAADAVAPIDAVLQRIQARWPDKIRLLRVIDFFCDSDCPVVKENLWLYSNRLQWPARSTWLPVARMYFVVFSTTNLDEKYDRTRIADDLADGIRLTVDIIRRWLRQAAEF